METKRQKRFNRKRKHETEESEIFISQNKNRHFGKAAQAEEEPKIFVSQNKNRHFGKDAQAEEDELTKDLFGDNSGFLKSLEEVELNSGSNQNLGGTDSGIGETETDSSNDESKRKPAWYDDDDEGIDVGTALASQGRKLPSGGVNSRSSQYSNLLQHKFKSLVGTPKWASLDKKDSDEDSDDEILKSCGHVIKSRTHLLRSDTLEYKKVKDLNQETYNEGPKISGIEFHPSYTVALVAGASGIASLLAVDGKRNNKLHSVAFDKYSIECAKFINGGNEALLGSNHAHFFSYDLNAAKAMQVQLPHGVTQCKKFEVSNINNIIAVGGKWGQVHLISTTSKELIATLKQNANVTTLTFSADEMQLFGHSVEGEVTVWDIGSRRVKHKWIDEGCLQGTTLATSPSGQYIATGSAQGVVNVYDVEKVFNSKNPKPSKTVMNLTTAISHVRFNSTSEVLGLTSNALANSVRMLHIGSGKVFSNFPPGNTKLGRINTLSFSPNSGYAAFGNMHSTVALYRLKHFNNY